MITRTVRTRRASRTSVGMKIAMAATGVIFLGFVLAHMYGNLKVFAGQEAFDDYAHHLRILGEPYVPYSGFLWIMRIVLLVSLLVHVWSAMVLWRQAHRARTTRYTVFKPVQATWSSRTMRWGGLAVLLFVVFHLLQFTTLTIEVGGSFESPYDRVVAAFETWYITALYAAAMAALGMHLRHGIWSAVQTLGWSTRRREPAIKATALVIAVATVAGFLAPPVAILLGLLS
ncbi:succinate dehydrogenase cytochrome b subunit [Georgenia subflava]|uniref:Succinate dehydrogenase n=1 Tax=Georgenia subflava TaxID=1622177 RepID=A0A6N7EC58_9MICO|nr:succinate dehydrogenase cytochrome b subunit [Georgenia subflava]MPV36002.1 succinate dehydrogenase [Georgenia subflava]